MAVDFTIADYCYPVEILRRRAFAERSQWLTPAALVEYQSSRLRQIVAHAYAQVPYYRELLDRVDVAPRDIRSVEDLPKIPLLSKSMVATHFEALTARHAWRYGPRRTRTSGSSGPPIEFYLDKASRVLEFVYYWRHWSWLGYRIGTPFAELSSVYFLNRPSRSHDLYFYEPLTRRLLLNSLRLSEEAVPAWTEAFARYQPRYLKGLASALRVLAELLEPTRGHFRLRGVFSTGDTLLSAHRKLVESVFGCQVLDSYGHMERTFAVSECPSGRYHVNSDYGVLELVPAEGCSAPSGELRTRVCRAVGTGLHNLAMPLIRYEVGDLIEVDESASPCPCGRGFPVIRKIGGRENDVIETPDGRLITSLFVVFDLVDHIEDGQIVQDDADRILVRVVRAASYQPCDEVALLSHLKTMLGEQVTITLDYVDRAAIQAGHVGKTRRVVSHVPSRLLRQEH